MGNAKIIAVDFDGTLCVEAYPAIGAPKTDIINLVKSMRAAGNIIILNTCRVGDRLTEAVDWCKSHGLEFDYINENAPQRIEQYGSDTRKISADAYIDDRAINPFDELTQKIIDLLQAATARVLELSQSQKGGANVKV